MTTMPVQTEDVSDEEIIAHTVRLARSGRFVVARPLMDELIQTYSDQPLERVKDCARQAADLMLRQHGDTPPYVRRR